MPDDDAILLQKVAHVLQQIANCDHHLDIVDQFIAKHFIFEVMDANLLIYEYFLNEDSEQYENYAIQEYSELG